MMNRLVNSFRCRVGNLKDRLLMERQVKTERKKRKAEHKALCAVSNEVNIRYWKMDGGKTNLGDYLAWVVSDHYRKNFCLSKRAKDGKVRHLYSIGSVLGLTCVDAVVWGSGTLGSTALSKRYIKSSKLDIRAVRGPLTRDFLRSAGKKCPQVYGDPAILMPRIYMPAATDKKYPCTLVLHHSHTPPADTRGAHLLAITTEDYKHFIDEIVASQRVISSSLHGIILAESYGEVVLLDLRYYRQAASELAKQEGFDNILVCYSCANFLTDTNLMLLR